MFLYTLQEPMPLLTFVLNDLSLTSAALMMMRASDSSLYNSTHAQPDAAAAHRHIHSAKSCLSRARRALAAQRVR